MTDSERRYVAPVDLLGLILNCPKGNPDSDCPAQPLRELPLEQIIQHVESLDETAIRELRQHHKSCWHRIGTDTDS